MAAKVEVGTFTHQGVKYSALGSIVDHDAGRIIGYPSRDNRTLMTWDGRTLGTLKVTGYACGFHCKLTCYRAAVDGLNYHGRGLGEGMILRLRRAVEG